MPPQTRQQRNKSRSSNSSSSSSQINGGEETTTTIKIEPLQEANGNNGNGYDDNADDAMILSRPTSHKSTATVGMCDIHEIGLENFIRKIAEVRNLSLDESSDDEDSPNGNKSNTVVFNLNDRAIIYSWDEVFEIERTYSTCLGIQERIYTCHGYIWKPESNLGYFVLEEYNRRSYKWLPNFHYSVLVMVYYDNPTSRTITKVNVQYDQMSFFLHVLGIQHVWRWFISTLVTPLAMMWMKLYRLTGYVNPVTFLIQLILFSLVGYQLFMKLLRGGEREGSNNEL